MKLNEQQAMDVVNLLDDAGLDLHAAIRQVPEHAAERDRLIDLGAHIERELKAVVAAYGLQDWYEGIFSGG